MCIYNSTCCILFHKQYNRQYNVVKGGYFEFYLIEFLSMILILIKEVNKIGSWGINHSFE